MNRRSYLKTSGAGLAGMVMNTGFLRAASGKESRIRLGGPVFGSHVDPGRWVEALAGRGYRAGYCPLEPGADESLIRAFEREAREKDIVIAEVGAWSNPLSPDPGEAARAFEKCVGSLELAEQIGARCCVNISGSKNPEYWAGPHPDNMTRETFGQVVEITRKIIDAVHPTRTCFALEAMPWSYPWSTESYLALCKAIDRKAFGVHLDPVNMITSPRDFYDNGKLIREMFATLGPRIMSCHAKDIILRQDNYIPQMDEVRPGMGSLDYGIFLKELSKLDDVPLMMEHLETDKEYLEAATYIRSVGATMDIRL